MRNPLARAVALGAATGLRSMTPIATLSWASASRRISPRPPFDMLRKPEILTLLAVAALGEYLGDKLPFTPSRTQPPVLACRAACGGVAGAAASSADRKSPLAGGALGACAAVAGAYAGRWARARIGEDLGVPDPLVGTVEDLVTVFLALRAVER